MLKMGDPRLADREWALGDSMEEYLEVIGYQACLAYFRTDSETHSHRCILALRHEGPHVAAANGKVYAIEGITW